jgi:gliding motility-associated-like protein
VSYVVRDAKYPDRHYDTLDLQVDFVARPTLAALRLTPARCDSGQQGRLAAIGRSPAGSVGLSLGGRPFSGDTALHPGTYALRLRGPRGCTTDSLVRLPLVPKVTARIEISPRPPLLTGQPIALSAEPPDQAAYGWTAGAAGQHQGSRWQMTTPDADSLHLRLVLTDSLGCRDTARQSLALTPFRTMIPTAVSPNGDGRNDTWIVRCGGTKAVRGQIFDRWGRPVARLSGTDKLRWSPRPALPEGVYTYALELHLLDGQTVRRRGTITLVR